MPTFMKYRRKGLFLVVLGICAWANTIHANERRVALVIGNGAYQNVTALANPVRDANLIQQELESLGFDVELALNTGRGELHGKVINFRNKMKSADVGLVYYAGHAVEVAGKNFLLPVDIPGGMIDIDIPQVSFKLDDLMKHMSYNNRAGRIVILDACRDNPFAANKATRSAGDPSHGGGLASLNFSGTFIAYATAPGNVALDGYGENSPYATSIAKYLAEPGLTINQVFNKVAAEVQRLTNGAQQPWVSGNTTTDYYLAGKETAEQRELLERARAAESAREADKGKIAALEAQIAAQKEKRQAQETARQQAAENERKAEVARVKVAEENRRQAEQAKIDAERKRLDELAEQERKQQNQAKVAQIEAEKARLEDLAAQKAEEERQAKLAEAAAEKKRVDELAKAEAAKQYQEQVASIQRERERDKKLKRVATLLKQCKQASRKKQYDEALDCYDNTLQLDPTNRTAEQGLAKIIRALEKSIAKAIRKENFKLAEENIALIDPHQPSKTQEYRDKIERGKADGSKTKDDEIKVFPTF